MQGYSYDRRIARLVQKHREDKNRDEWALIESDGPKVLKWFGVTKPSDEAVAKEEARIQSFKHKDAALTMVEYEYGQWKDEGGRWAIKRRREPTETFVARDLKGKWSSPPGSLSEAMEALKVKAKTDVTFQHQRYSYDRRRNKLLITTKYVSPHVRC